MKKTTIKKMLALVVGVLIIAASLTAGFGVLAADTANSEPLNLDFSDGLNHWTGETTIYTAEGGVLKTNDTYASGSWRWLKTEPFTIPNAVVGTVVELYLDIAFEDGLPSMNGNENQAGALASNPANKLVDTFFADPSLSDTARYSQCTEENGQRNQIFYNEEGTVLIGSQTIADPAQEFDFWLGCGNSAKKTWEISNIILKVTHPDGTVELYPEGAEDPNPPAEGGDDVEEPETPAVTIPAYYGTEENGFDSATNALYKLKPVEGLQNLDFSKGFTYWAGRKNGGNNAYAGECFDIVTEADGNKYVKVKDTGWVTSIRSAVFAVEGLEEGDKIGCLYDVKGADGGTFHIKIVQAVLKAGMTYDEVTGMTAETEGYVKDEAIMVGSGVAASDFDVNLGADGWTTRSGFMNAPVKAIAPENEQKVLFEVTITSDYGGAAAGDVLDAAIDNLRIVKVVDGVYTDLATGEVVYDANNVDDGAGEGEGTGTGTGTGSGSSSATGDSVLALAALFFVSGAAVFGTAKAMKNR